MIVERTLKSLRTRRQRVLDGYMNCIESPFERFKQSGSFVGIEQGKYYLFLGETKTGKTMLVNYLALYNSLEKAYNNSEVMDIKIFYFALEETPEVILEKYMCYLLYTLSKRRIAISTLELKSVDSSNPISSDILDLLSSEEYLKRLNFFEEHVVFSTTSHPTGIYKELMAFVETNGTIYRRPQKIKDDNGNIKEIQIFDHYVPKNPNLYVMSIIDTVNLISPEQGLSLRESINKLSSKYLIKLRNNYNLSPIVIQQCNSDTQTADSFKLGRLRPTLNSPGDSKYTTKDANVTMALFSPWRYEKKEYLGYDITRLRDNVRFLEVLTNREGNSNDILPLFFYGACNYFKELPRATDTILLEKVYEEAHRLREVKRLAINNKSNTKRIFLTYRQIEKKNKIYKYILQLVHKVISL